ncbi:MAG: N-acetylmuramoyl-L-alanine amidase [Tepidisphaeraceae bacterium]
MTKHTRPHSRAASLAARGLILVMAILAGCQMESDADLPPVRLASPVVLAPQPAPRPLVAAPRPIPQPTPQPAASGFAPDPGSGVPASWMPSAPANHWTWIIIHHSDSDYGSAAIIDKWHRDRGFDELGYHFVIGNGTNSGDGQIEVGPRWTKQKWGAHDNALDNRYNTNGIGICLVGNFNKTRPTPRQLHSLVRLVVYLMRKYDIPADRVLGHGETKVTQCPGRYLNVAAIRDQASRLLAEGNTSMVPFQYADER